MPRINRKAHVALYARHSETRRGLVESSRESDHTVCSYVVFVNAVDAVSVAKKMRGILAVARRLIASQQIIPHSRRQISHQGAVYPPDFTFLPDFFTVSEQRVLLSEALKKLDQNEPLSYRRRRKGYKASSGASSSDDVQDLFLPDEYYCFEQVFDHQIRSTSKFGVTRLYLHVAGTF